MLMPTRLKPEPTWPAVTPMYNNPAHVYKTMDDNLYTLTITSYYSGMKASWKLFHCRHQQRQLHYSHFFLKHQLTSREQVILKKGVLQHETTTTHMKENEHKHFYLAVSYLVHTKLPNIANQKKIIIKETVKGYCWKIFSQIHTEHRPHCFDCH